MSNLLPTRDLELLGSGIASSDRISALLENALMFRDLEWNQIQTLSNYLQLYRANPGAVLFREGEKGDFMCVVLEGKLDIRKENTQGEEKTVTTVMPGRSLGEMAMVDGEPRSATAVVMAPATLAVLTYDNFQLMLRDKPALAGKMLQKIAQLLSQRLRQTSGMLVDYLEH
jgi:CRP-like cAMP-binding protein